MKPTNVTRLLDQRKIAYTAHQLPSEKLGALEVAGYLGVPSEVVFKTIVVKRSSAGKPILALVPGTQEVDLKALAKVIGEKKVVLPTQREAERITGLQAGGISPLALLNRGFRVILDSSAEQHKEIYISGGQRGLDIQLPVPDLISLTNARVAEIST
jgi:Cys-tRNA(Pro)/Cys-tRNA(Cys) deacylase